MSARAVFEKVCNAAYWWASNKLPGSIREAASGTGSIRYGKPGEFIGQYISDADRAALKDLKSEDVAQNTYNAESAKWAAYMGTDKDTARTYAENLLKEEKIKFDQKILKDSPSADRKKY